MGGAPTAALFGKGRRAPWSSASWVMREREKMPGPPQGLYPEGAVVGGHKVVLAHRRNMDDGRIGEIFIDMHKEGARRCAPSSTILPSRSRSACNTGVPLEEYGRRLPPSPAFEPNGPVQGNDSIKFATSILDYVFRELAVQLHGAASDLAHVDPSENQLRRDGAAGVDEGQGAGINPANKYLSQGP